ncbi:MAG: S-layer homology domain-containing protein, partial [Clostridia bacterium]|nr:S-layer homology domain-containing protein [Clostridia bacterium]
MKRKATKLISLILMSTLVLSLSIQPAMASDYSGHWAKEYIDFVKTSGYWTDEGDFKPDQAITRAEFSALLARTLGAAVVEIVPDFDDVN